MPPVKKESTHEWDAKIEPLMRALIGRDGIRTRQAAEIGRRAVDYFRGSDFAKWTIKHRSRLTGLAPTIFADESPDMDSANFVALVGAALLRGGFVYRAHHSVQPGTEASRTDQKVPKWPKRLAMAPQQSFDENAFYVICYEGSRWWRHALLALIILSVLVICMFPAWPIPMKLGVWYFAFSLSTLILAAVVARLVLFALVWFFGADFWILPNLFDEELGVVDSFIPFFFFEYRRDSWIMFVARIFCGVCVGAAIHQLGQTHSISDVHLFAKRQFLDVLDWGHQKLAPPPDVQKFAGPTNPIRSERPRATARSAKMASSSGGSEAVIEEEDDLAQNTYEEENFECLQQCGFKSFDELMEECMTECACMEELVKSVCYKRCPANTQKTLDEAHLDACHEEKAQEDETPEEVGMRNEL